MQRQQVEINDLILTQNLHVTLIANLETRDRKTLDVINTLGLLLPQD